MKPAICSNLDGPWCIMLSEISQIEKDKYHMIALICGICETEEMNKHSKT